MKYQVLEMVGISGEFPVNQLHRLIESSSYAEKIITELKNEKLIRTHYRDRLRGYRLTKHAKELLLAQNMPRFHDYLTGNTETNLIRSELPRRIRLHQKAEIYLTLLHANIPYSSREIKTLGYDTTKIRNSRSVGILLSPQCVYALYNTGNSVLKWEYKTEVRLTAFLQHYLQGRPYHGRPAVRAIMTGKDMDTAYHLLTSTGGYRKSLFLLDTTYEHFHYLPNNIYGEYLLRLLVRPQMLQQLDRLLLSDYFSHQEELPIEHDGIDSQNHPVLLAYDFDMQRINRFNTGLNVYDLSGILVCFDFQIPCLRKYLTADIQFSSIDFQKFKRGFFHEKP